MTSAAKEETYKNFLPAAKIALEGKLSGDPRDEACVSLLARLLDSAARGQGFLPKKDCGDLPDPLPQDFFVQDGEKILLPRYAACWGRIREYFEREISAPRNPAFADAAVRSELDRILPHATDGTFDNARQRLAVAALVDANVGVITGGPGTGKTTCAAALLALRKRLQPGLDSPQILVAAPTGKAACRLGESLAKAAGRLAISEEEKQFLRAIVPQTLHKALEWTPKPPEKGGPFLRNASRKLPHRIVLVDEASMMDLELMNHLVAALPDPVTLLLLGDSDQLESVETGGVLAELVDRGSAPPEASIQTSWLERTGKKNDAQATGNSNAHPLPGLVVRLEHSYRAKDAPWILDLARIVRPGSTKTAKDFAHAVKNLGGEAKNCVKIYTDKKEFFGFCDGMWRRWAEVVKLAEPHKSGQLSPEILAALSSFQLLCGTNYQVEQANRRGMKILTDPGGRSFPHGCPILIRANSRTLGLSNGDIGIAIAGAGNGRADEALFPGIEGAIPLARLPECAPAFALTIHKSQGSEWETVALELPEEDSELLDRNLAYTAITRASKNFHLFYKGMALERLLG